jgi:hypothetical protein
MHCVYSNVNYIIPVLQQYSIHSSLPVMAQNRAQLCLSSTSTRHRSHYNSTSLTEAFSWPMVTGEIAAGSLSIGGEVG